MRSFDYDLIILIVYNLLESEKLKKRTQDHIYMLLKKEIKRHLIINNNNLILKKHNFLKKLTINFFYKDYNSIQKNSKK